MTDVVSPIIPIGSYIPPYMPLSNITPFTYRDGLTYLEVLECLRTYVNTTLVDFVNTNFGVLGDAFSSEVNTLIEAVNTQLDTQTTTVNTAIANLTTYIDGATADDKTYVDAQIATMQAAVDQAVTDVENSAITLQDSVMAGIVSDNASETRTSLDTLHETYYAQDVVQLDTRYPQKGSLFVNVKDYGAVSDFNGVGGTDASTAINAAIQAVVEGGTVVVPPGKYYLTAPIIIDKAIDFTCGAGGINAGSTGTQLNFAAGVSGIQVITTGTISPSKWRVGPFRISSLSTAAGTDIGIFITSGRGIIDRPTVENFGSHGIHVKAGAAYGGNNANNTVIEGVRAYANRGDGIRIEGTDANACLVVKPDVVANYGYGINLTACSMCKVTAPHADQQYNGSPGAFRDNGSSNDWDWLYSEAGISFTIDAGSSHGRLAVSVYGAPTIITVGSGYLSWRISQQNGNTNIANYKSLTGSKVWQIQPGSFAADSYDLIQSTDAKRVFTVDSGVTRVQWYTGHIPSVTASYDIGIPSNKWRNAYFTGSVGIGTFATADRPAANGAGMTGACIYDTTLGKPIWSNGAAWHDATGTAV